MNRDAPDGSGRPRRRLLQGLPVCKANPLNPIGESHPTISVNDLSRRNYREIWLYWESGSGFSLKKKKKLSLLPNFPVGQKSSITFRSGGVLQQMRVLINSTHPYLQNKTDLRQKYFEMKKLQMVKVVNKSDYFPIGISSIIIKFNDY